MALFSGLGDRFNQIFNKLTKRGKLTETEIKESMREVKIALLEADVNYIVVKDFVLKVSEKCLGDSVLKSLNPSQQVIKNVRDELTLLMQSPDQKLNLGSNMPAVIMLCGLQGAGKTTMCAKLAYYLKSQGKKTLLVACDIYRPAAIDQLKVVGKQAGTEVFERGMQNPVKTATEAISHALKQGYDTVILDTAGRLHNNLELMSELQKIKEATTPAEILLVVDAMTGQDAVTIAQSFNMQLEISGVVITKLDGDTRGGAALSMRQVTGKPIKFCGVGEKISDIEVFHADRIASRILGMGDILSLIEKAEQSVSQNEKLRMEKAFRENSFTFEDYLVQVENMKKMGNIKDVLAMVPGLSGKIKDIAIDEKAIEVNKAIVQSMTKKERLNPVIIKANQKKRIANGSGTSVQQVNRLMNQFEQMKLMLKQMKNKRSFR
ncbi:MAG: signal recognition particle protein [Clostridia bacterium]